MNIRRAQDGYVLILVLLALLGFGGVVLAGFTQQAKQEQDARRYEYNKRVLKEAKQALLQYAFDYPGISPGNGPGRLPCPDVIGDDGIPESPTYCTSGTPLVGRFPWNAAGMNFYDARDASNERLWYAVSSNFAFTGPPTINSDTVGTITVVDQSGNTLYDGTATGIAAVIIAPGPEIARDENNDGDYEYPQDRDADPLDPRNYLDTFNGFRNDLFNNAENDSDDDGFILGPLRETDPNSPAFNTVVVNDQMILITTEEVVRMAQKSVLYHYKEAINNYRANLGVDVYPWLDDYTTLDLTQYDGDVGVRLGRVPSMFAEYFSTNPVDGQPIISDLVIDISIDGFDSSETIPASAIPDIYFKADGNLSTSFTTPHSITRYYWDGHDSNTPSSPADGIWELCPVVTGTEDDCNQDGYNNFIGGPTSVDWMKVREITITLTYVPGSPGDPFEFPYDDRAWPGVPLNFIDPTSTSHARVTGEYNDNSTNFFSATWTQDNNFQSSFMESPAGNNGTFVFDAGDSVDVTLVFYPALPDWALASEDDWHDSVQFAYSAGFEPGATSVCTAGVDCLTINDSGGIQNDKIAILTLASEHTIVDAGAAGYQDDLGQIFDAENAHAQDLAMPGTGDDDPNDGILDQDVFTMRAGNDDLLVVR